MSKNSLQYIQLSPNFRIIANPVNQYEAKYNIHLSAGGAYFEQHNEHGLSHLLEHCMVVRTKEHDFQQLKSFLFEKDIYTNAYTSRLGMDFVVSGHKSDTDIIVDLITQFALEPTLTEEVLKQEKEIVLREMSQCQGGPGYRLNRILIESVFTPDSCAFTEVLGLKNDVKNSTLDQLREIRRRMISQSHFIITATGGGVNIDTLAQKLEPYVKRYIAENTLPVNFQPRNILREFKYLPVVNDLGHDHAVLNIVIPCSVTLDNRPARTFIKELLLEHPIGVLYNRLRNELGLVYGINYSFDISSDTLSLELSCEISNIIQIIDEVKRSFSDFKSVVSQEKINIIKNIIVKRREINQDDPEFVGNFLVNILTDFGVLLNYDDYIRKIEQTTLEDIEAFYNEISTNLEKMQIVVVSNKAEIKDLKIQ